MVTVKSLALAYGLTSVKVASTTLFNPAAWRRGIGISGGEGPILPAVPKAVIIGRGRRPGPHNPAVRPGGDHAGRLVVRGDRECLIGDEGRRVDCLDDILGAVDGVGVGDCCSDQIVAG